MTLSTASRISFSRDYNPVDPDALAYLAAVEAADEAASPGIGALEQGVRNAVNEFVLGCKADGIWPAIKASCILAGARTLDGALVPLVGTAPTNVGGLFVSGDYNRKTGLVGNGADKYLNSNRANNADPQDSQHLAFYGSNALTTNSNIAIGAGGTSSGRSFLAVNALNSNNALVTAMRSSANSGQLTGSGMGIGFYGSSRSASAAFESRGSGNNYTTIQASQAPTSDNIYVFCRNNGSGTAEFFTLSRLAFYSIGEALDLARLDTRVTDLINAIGAAIP